MFVKINAEIRKTFREDVIKACDEYQNTALQANAGEVASWLES